MPILGSIQRRSRGGRLLLGGIYVLLTLGGVWMVYPFLLLLSGSVKSETDIRQFDIFPRYLTDDLTLFRKFEEQRYGGQLEVFAAATRCPVYSFEYLKAPPRPSAALIRDWEQFKSNGKSWPEPFLQLGHNLGASSELTLEYSRRLQKTFPSIPKEELSARLIAESWPDRGYQGQGVLESVYEQMRRDLPSRYFRPTTVEGFFITQYLRPKFGSGSGTEGVKRLNQMWNTDYASLYDVALSSVPPAHPAQRKDWWNFLKNTLSTRFIRFSPSLLPAYQNFLKTKYGDITALNKAHQTTYASWNQAAFPENTNQPAIHRDLEGFLQTLQTPSGISLDAPDFRWRNFLKEKYHGNLAALNQSHGTRYSSFEEAPMPVYAHDWKIMQENRASIIRDFLTRNYRVVWDYFSANGRAFQNTLIFCFLNVLTALIINPIAAYALSRFQPRWGYKALFVLMATMAFPGEVTQIPSFLMLREMGLLNTFAALVIPSAANGFSIFLLKGFFDSLPKELYESATIDGAGELRIFRTIAIPLSTPILAVIALGAFISAYSAFMFALLVCQKQSMWTLMVHIYQLQQFYETPVIFAALVLAAIPTLLIFVFCQNIIMRGIVIPVEK